VIVLSSVIGGSEFSLVLAEEVDESAQFDGVGDEPPIPSVLGSVTGGGQGGTDSRPE
jgi:hypothetical protein